MDSKEIALQIIKSQEEFKIDITNLKSSLQDLLAKYLKKVKEIGGEIPDEKTFLKVLSEILDEEIKLPQPYESVDGWIFDFILKIVDSKILDKWFGSDWFEKLKVKIL